MTDLDITNPTTVIPANVEDRLLTVYGHVLQQLMSSEKFNAFFELNYRLEQTLDEESKTVEVKLVELSQQETQQKLAKKVSELVEEKGKVKLASAADLRKINASPTNRTGYKV